MTHSGWNGRLPSVPEDRAGRYRDSGEWSTEPTGRRLHEVALRFPGRWAVVTQDESMTYAELDTRTDQIAAALMGLGLRRLDPVLFQLTNRMGTILAWYGCLKAGLVPVATLAAHRMHEIGHISRKVGAVGHIVEAGLPFDLVHFARSHADGHPSVRHVITVGEQPDGTPPVTRLESLGTDIDPGHARALVEAVEQDTDPLDVAVFQLSGGTTGVPKVIPRLHAEYWNNGLFYARHLGWDENSRIAHLIPVIHNAGISCALHAAHSVGACLVLATADARAAFDLMARTRTTDVLVGHGLYQSVLAPEFAPARAYLKRVVLSGAKVSQELFERVDGQGCWAGQMFGMSEGLFAVTPLGSPVEARLTTVGVPIARSDEIRVLEPGTETELPDEQVGELCCRGPYTITGYFDAPEHNRVSFTSDGFYRTGDLAKVTVIDGQRYLSIEGRIKDLINRGGEKINAEEVETLLLAHPNIRQAAVVAMPDARLGEKTCAYVVSTTSTRPLSLRDVQHHLETLGVAKFKWPERLEWVEELPQTNVGKIDKKRLRGAIADKVTSEAAQAGQRPLSV